MEYSYVMDYKEKEKKFGRIADFYFANKDSIDNGHEGEFVLMGSMNIEGYYKSHDAAELEAYRSGLEPGLFFIHECGPEKIWDMGGYAVEEEA